MISRPASVQGFTLLEVMVALTITGLALGGLFGIIAGSKRLAWRAEQALVYSSQVRSLINFSQLNDEQGEVFVRFENDELELASGSELPFPERQVFATNQELRGYEITDDHGEVIAQGTYWIFPEQPRVPPGAANPGSGNGNDAGQNGFPPANVQGSNNQGTLGIRGIRPPQRPPRDAADAPPPAPPPGAFQ